MALKLATLDTTVQGGFQAVGLQRLYFDAREYARARLERPDLTPMRQRNAFFVHVPKCAGTSVIVQAPIALGHRSAQFARWHDPAFWDRVFTFGFVRDPYERMISAFHYLRSDKTSRRDGEWGRANVGHYADFAAFMEDLQHPAVRRRVLGWMHFLPQTFYLCDRRNRILVDFVGRTEDMGNALDQINRQTGLGLELLYHRKVDRQDDDSRHTARSARLVEEIYASDFEVFGYPRRAPD